MHVWVMTKEFEPYIVGGMGVVSTNLAKEFLKTGIQVKVFTMYPPKIISITNHGRIQVIRFPQQSNYYKPQSRSLNPNAVIRFLDASKFHKPDIIHIHSLGFTELAAYYKNRYKIPIVYTCHSLTLLEINTSKQSPISIQQEKLFRIANRIVVPSVWLRNQIIKYYPFCSGKIQVIHNGVEIRDGSSHYQSVKNRILYVGRLVPSKGIAHLLKAVAILSRKRKDIKLDIIGTGSTRYLGKLKVLTYSLGIQRNVRWLGYRQPGQMKYLYSSYDAVIVPSKQESFCLVALEALANNVPLVSTRIGGLAEFVNKNVAQIIPQVQPQAIAQAIERMYNQTNLTKHRVLSGRKVAMGYRWSVVAEQYKRLFFILSKKQ